jgi:hypothetical protein
MCGYNIPTREIDSSSQRNFSVCIEDCTTRGPTCGGVVWSETDKRCGRRGKETSFKDLRDDPAYTSALAFKSQLDIPTSRIVCPAPNLSMQRSASGRAYKIRCGSWFGNAGDILARRHTSTLEECMNYCDELRPLCSRANFNSDQNNLGWVNCELKNMTAVTPGAYTRTMGHTAEAEAIHLTKEPCAPNSIQIASDGREFRISCSDQRVLDDALFPPLRTVHDTSLGNCVQQCTDANFTCNAALFDISLQSGYRNCYLFDKIPPPGVRHSGYTFTYLDTMLAQYTSPPPEPKSGNKDWIAGAVLGPITFCTVGGLLLYWYFIRRPKKKSKAS